MIEFKFSISVWTDLDGLSFYCMAILKNKFKNLYKVQNERIIKSLPLQTNKKTNLLLQLSHLTYV